MKDNQRQFLSLLGRAPARLTTNKPAFYIALTTMIMGTLFFLTGFVAELVVRNAADRNDYLTEERVGW